MGPLAYAAPDAEAHKSTTDDDIQVPQIAAGEHDAPERLWTKGVLPQNGNAQQQPNAVNE